MPIEIKMHMQHILYYELEQATNAKCFLLKQINQEAYMYLIFVNESGTLLKRQT